MPSVNVDLNYREHPKITRLVSLCGGIAEAMPIWLWIYCGKFHAEDGNLSGYSSQEIERIVGWRGKTSDLVNAMVKVGLLEEFEGGFRVHDWEDHAKHFVTYREKAKKAAAARWAGKKGGNQAETMPQAMLKHCSSNAPSNAQAMPLQCSAVQEEINKSRDPPIPVPVTAPLPAQPPPTANELRFPKPTPLGQFEAAEVAPSLAALWAEKVGRAHSIPPGAIASWLMNNPVEVEGLREAIRNFGADRDLWGTAADMRPKIMNWLSDGTWKTYLPENFKPPTPQELARAKRGPSRNENPVPRGRVPIDFSAPPRGTVIELPPDWKPTEGPDPVLRPP